MRIILPLLLLFVLGCSSSPFYQARDSFVSHPDTDEGLRGWVPTDMPKEEWSNLDKLPKSKKYQEECILSLKNKMPRNVALSKVTPAFEKCMSKIGWKAVGATIAVVVEASKKPAQPVSENKSTIEVALVSDLAEDNDQTKGVWFEDELTGKLFRDFNKAAIVSRVRINGIWYAKSAL